MQTPTIFTIIGFFCKLFIKREMFSNYLLGVCFYLHCVKSRGAIQRGDDMWHWAIVPTALRNGLLHLQWRNHFWTYFWQRVYLTSFAQWIATLAVVGAFALNVTNSILSCGNNITANESKVQRFATNLDEDSDDDDYMISNSYVED